jgi:hypothetical protein
MLRQTKAIPTTKGANHRRPACACFAMEDRMSHYRGYFMKNDHIVAPTHIEAASDAAAMLKASELVSVSQFHCIEVWQQARIVGALPAAKDEHSFGDRASNVIEFGNR